MKKPKKISVDREFLETVLKTSQEAYAKANQATELAIQVRDEYVTPHVKSILGEQQGAIFHPPTNNQIGRNINFILKLSRTERPPSKGEVEAFQQEFLLLCEKHGVGHLEGKYLDPRFMPPEENKVYAKN